jgi:hypothetical protein
MLPGIAHSAEMDMGLRLACPNSGNPCSSQCHMPESAPIAFPNPWRGVLEALWLEPHPDTFPESSYAQTNYRAFWLAL